MSLPVGFTALPVGIAALPVGFAALPVGLSALPVDFSAPLVELKETNPYCQQLNLNKLSLNKSRYNNYDLPRP